MHAEEGWVSRLKKRSRWSCLSRGIAALLAVGQMILGIPVSARAASATDEKPPAPPSVKPAPAPAAKGAGKAAKGAASAKSAAKSA